MFSACQVEAGKGRIRQVFCIGKTNKLLHVGRICTMVKVMRCRDSPRIFRHKQQS